MSREGHILVQFLMETPLIANGAEISRINGFVKIEKIERKAQALGRISIYLQDRLNSS